MIGQSLLKLFCRFFFYIIPPGIFLQGRDCFRSSAMCGTNAGCLQKKKKKTGIFWKHRGKNENKSPPKNIGNEFSLRAVHNNGKTIKNTSSGKGEIVLHRHWYLICKAPVSFWWSWTNELAPLMIFSPVLLPFFSLLYLFLSYSRYKMLHRFFFVCVNNYTQTHSKQLDVEVIYNSSENGDTHIHTNTQVNIHHALGNFLVGK